MLTQADVSSCLAKLSRKARLSQFMCNRVVKVVDECFAIADELATAKPKFERSQKSCLQLLTEMHKGECVVKCNGQWLAAAINLLLGNESSELFCPSRLHTVTTQQREI